MSPNPGQATGMQGIKTIEQIQGGYKKDACIMLFDFSGERRRAPRRVRANGRQTWLEDLWCR
jgi:hypothetical protein